jgi:hypothetical protein
MNSCNDSVNEKKSKPVELQRWEGEGGNPPLRSTERTSQITGILARLLAHLPKSKKH